MIEFVKAIQLPTTFSFPQSSIHTRLNWKLGMKEREAKKRRLASPASDGDRKVGKQERNAASLRDEKGERDEKGRELSDSSKS